MSEPNPQALMDSAACFACLDEATKQTLRLQLLCRIADLGEGCNVQSLMNSAACFACLDEATKQTLRLQLLCRIADLGEGCNVQSLMNSAACFACLDEATKQTLRLQLLCFISENQITIPEPPTGLTVGVSGGEFDLQWVDSFADELGFIIEWSFDELIWEIWGTVPPNTTSVSIPPTPVTGPPSNIAIYWRVKAFNDAGESGPSNVESATVADNQRISVNKLIPTILMDETRIESVDVNKLVVTVILDETYP